MDLSSVSLSIHIGNVSFSQLLTSAHRPSTNCIPDHLIVCFRFLFQFSSNNSLDKNYLLSYQNQKKKMFNQFDQKIRKTKLKNRILTNFNRKNKSNYQTLTNDDYNNEIAKMATNEFCQHLLQYRFILIKILTEIMSLNEIYINNPLISFVYGVQMPGNCYCGANLKLFNEINQCAVYVSQLEFAFSSEKSKKFDSVIPLRPAFINRAHISNSIDIGKLFQKNKLLPMAINETIHSDNCNQNINGDLNNVNNVTNNCNINLEQPVYFNDLPKLATILLEYRLILYHILTNTMVLDDYISDVFQFESRLVNNCRCGFIANLKCLIAANINDFQQLELKYSSLMFGNSSLNQELIVPKMDQNKNVSNYIKFTYVNLSTINDPIITSRLIPAKFSYENFTFLPKLIP